DRPGMPDGRFLLEPHISMQPNVQSQAGRTRTERRVVGTVARLLRRIRPVGQRDEAEGAASGPATPVSRVRASPRTVEASPYEEWGCQRSSRTMTPTTALQS